MKLIRGGLPLPILDALAYALCGASGFEALLDADVPPTINVGESGGKELADAYDAALITIPTTRSWCRRAIRVGSEANGAIHEVPPAPVPVPIPAAHGRLRPAGEPAAFIAAQLRAASSRLADAVAVLGRRWVAGEDVDHALDVLAAAQSELESVIDDMRRIRREAEYLETQGRG